MRQMSSELEGSHFIYKTEPQKCGEIIQGFFKELDK